MKRVATLLLAVLLAACGLVGCAKKIDPTVVWQATLTQSGAQVALANCTLVSEEPVDYTPDKHDPNWQKMPALTANGVPVVTIAAAPDLKVEVAFLQQVDTLFLPYTKVAPQIKLDYILTENEDGSLTYRFDTVTPFVLTVTTATGSDTFALVCQRDL